MLCLTCTPLMCWYLCSMATANLTCIAAILPLPVIAAGLVFTPLTCWYLRSVYGADWSCKAPIKLVEKAFAASKRDSQEEVVVLSKVRSERNTKVCCRCFVFAWVTVTLCACCFNDLAASRRDSQEEVVVPSKVRGVTI